MHLHADEIQLKQAHHGAVSRGAAHNDMGGDIFNTPDQAVAQNINERFTHNFPACF